MNRRLQIGILIVLLGIAMAVAGIFTLGKVISQFVSPLPQPTAPPVLTEKVVVTTHDITVGVAFKPEDVTTMDMPVEVIPRNAMKETGAVVGRMATASMVSGELVLSHRLADPNYVSHDIAYTLDDTSVLMAFPASDLMSTLNIIQRGDIVDIFVSIEQQVPSPNPSGVTASTTEEEVTESRTFTFDALQRVGVTAMVVEILNAEPTGNVSVGGDDTPAPTPQPSDVLVQAYLLALAPQDALMLKHLIDVGAHFDFVLRAPTSTELFNLKPVISEYLIDRYELEIAR